VKSRQRSGILRRPIRWVRGASSSSDSQTTSILVSIDAEKASQPIVGTRGWVVRTVLRDPDGYGRGRGVLGCGVVGSPASHRLMAGHRTPLFRSLSYSRPQCRTQCLLKGLTVTTSIVQPVWGRHGEQACRRRISRCTVGRLTRKRAQI